MARYAIVHNGLVTNVIEASAEVAAQLGAISAPAANVGDGWTGAAFTAAPPSSPPVPAAVSMAQARVALTRAGIGETAVDAVIEALPDGQAKTEARIWWECSAEVHRTHPVVLALAPALGLSEGQIDELFRAAAAI